MTYKKIIQVIDYDTEDVIFEAEAKNEKDFIKLMNTWAGKSIIDIANEEWYQKMQSFMSMEIFSYKLNKIITKEIFMIWYTKA